MNLQPLYDVKERLEYAAVAGVSLLGEDFRLQRAAEGLKPLAAASPVFGKIDAGLTKLLDAPAERRPGLLLDVLALVDAVAYTQAKTGAEGELEPLPTGDGRYHQISYGQMTPLLTALTSTGGGRVEAVKSAWERHPRFFEDYRVLPALVKALGDSYGEMAELCARLLQKLGPSVVPALKRGFDPSGKKEMARRVEAIAAIEGKDAVPWLREVLPAAKKDVRVAVIRALGVDSGDTALLLDLAKAERGKNRDAVLEALTKQDGDEVAAFWEKELAQNGGAITFMGDTRADWASDLVARRLWDRMEQLLAQGGPMSRAGLAELRQWFSSVRGKSSPSMLDFWRWMDGKLADVDRLRGENGQALGFGAETTALLLDSLCQAGPGPLCGLCLELWGRHRDQPRYLPHAVVASLLTRPAAEVYDAFSPYVPTVRPLLGGAQKQALHNAVLTGLSEARWNNTAGRHEVGAGWPTAQRLDARWVKRLACAVWKTTMHDFKMPSPFGYGEHLEEYDIILTRLLDPSEPEVRADLIPYLRRRMAEAGSYQTYSRWLLALGGSPRGVLKDSMLKSGRPAYLYYIWGLLNDAAKALSAEETVDLCREALNANYIRKEDAPLAQRAIPWTVEQLRPGRPFPDWSDWWNMR